MKQSPKGFSIIYVFVIITLIALFAWVLINKQSYFEKNIEFSYIKGLLGKYMYSQASLTFWYNATENQTGGLFQPFLSCPENIEYYSWWILLSTGTTTYQDKMCSGILNGADLQLFYTGSYMMFASGALWWTWFQLSWNSTLTWSTWSWNMISFEKPIQIDDRYIQSKTQMRWVILQNTWWNHIFWSNSDITQFIASNTHNTWSVKMLGQTGSGILYFDINDTFSWKIVQFDKNIFNTQKKLVSNQEFLFSNIWWAIGYLQNDGTFTGNTLNAKKFDFIQNDYAIFLSYSSWTLWNIRYVLKVMDADGTPVYINPLKDDIDVWQYFWNSIVSVWEKYYNLLQIIYNY